MAEAIVDLLSAETAQSVRPVATFAVLLARRAVLLSSVLTPSVDRVGSAEPGIELLRQCCDAATRNEDHPLAQLLDWTCLAWTGNPHDGSFFAGRHLPEHLYAGLQQMLDHTRAPMLAATAEQTLKLRIGQLEDSVERHSAVDRGFCRSLLVEPVAEVLSRLSTERSDGGLLEYDADELVKRANAKQDRLIPMNGRRWPLLVRAVADVREQVRELLDVAEIADAEVPGPPAQASEDLPPGLEMLLSAATLIDPDPEAPRLGDGVPLLLALVDAALVAIGPQQRASAVRLASWATAAAVTSETVNAVLAPVRVLTARADDAIASLQDQGQDQDQDQDQDQKRSVAELRELVSEAVRRGDVAEITAAVDLLESERDRVVLVGRIAAVDQSMVGVDDPARSASVERYLRVARERLAVGDLADVSAFVAHAETEAAVARRPRGRPSSLASGGPRFTGTGSPPSEGPAPGSAAAPRTPSSPAVRPASEEDEAAAKRLYEKGRTEEAVLLLRRLLQRDPRSPGAFLLLRIYREQNRLDRSVELVDQLVEEGVANWRHHVELCRNAIAAGDLDVASEQYRRAERCDADDAWLSPLRRGMRAARSPDPDLKAPVTTALAMAGQTDDVVLRLRAGELNQPSWRQIIGTQLAAAGLDRALALTREAAGVAFWTPSLLFQALHLQEQVAIDDRQAEELIDLTRAHAHDQSMIVLADVLLAAGWPEHALRVLETAERIAAPSQLPRLWFVRRAALCRLGRDDEAATLLRHSRPPLPDPERDEPPVAAPAVVPELFWPRVLTNSAVPLVREGQLHHMNGDHAAAADAWTAAVRAGHHLAFPSALAALVASGRPAAALDLYTEHTDVLWVGAGAAWNLGCAYAAAGQWHAAADSFAYHARIRSQPFDLEQQTALRDLFAAVGRPLPVVAPSAPGSSASDAVDAWSRSDTHNFFVTAASIRGALRRSGRAEGSRQLARVEALYAELSDPDPTATAELVRTLAAGGRRDQAWRIVTAAIERTGAARALLAPALQIARESDPARLAYLRKLLEHHQDGDDFEIFLHLAKIASLQNDHEACLRHASRAMELNPSSTEAASLLSSPSTVGPEKLANEIRHLGRERPEEVAAGLEPIFAPAVADLRMSTVSLLGAVVDEKAAKFELQADDVPLVDEALLAARDASWEEAARLFRQALDNSPRHLGLATATVSALIRVARLDVARTIADTISYNPMGREAQARVAFAARDYRAAADHLANRDRGRSLREADVLGRAGLHLHFLDDPTTAAQVLLESARSRLPGNPSPHAAMASVLALQHGLTEVCVDSVGVLFVGALDSAAAIRWAIEHDNLEALLESHAPKLRQTDLAALVAHFDGDQRDRLRRFLKRKGHTFFMRELAKLDERDGRTLAAFETRWELTNFGSRDQLTHLRDLMRFC